MHHIRKPEYLYQDIRLFQRVRNTLDIIQHYNSYGREIILTDRVSLINNLHISIDVNFERFLA